MHTSEVSRNITVLFTWQILILLPLRMVAFWENGRSERIAGSVNETVIKIKAYLIHKIENPLDSFLWCIFFFR